MGQGLLAADSHHHSHSTGITDLLQNHYVEDLSLDLNRLAAFDRVLRVFLHGRDDT